MLSQSDRLFLEHTFFSGRPQALRQNDGYSVMQAGHFENIAGFGVGRLQHHYEKAKLPLRVTDEFPGVTLSCSCKCEGAAPRERQLLTLINPSGLVFIFYFCFFFFFVWTLFCFSFERYNKNFQPSVSEVSKQLPCQCES